MSPRMSTPTEMGSVAKDIFTVIWSDGHHSTYSWRSLRANCPCARCKGEWGAVRPQIRVQDVSAQIRATSVNRVGAYALRFVWSDGHNTGIYPFVFLRTELCECPECGARRANTA